MLLVTMRLQ